MKTILNIIYKLDKGGIETFLLNMFDEIDTSENKYLLGIESGEIGEYDSEIKNKGIEIIYFKKNSKFKLINSFHNLKEIKTRYEISVVHSHSYFYSSVYMIFGFILNIKIRIAHSHDTSKGKKMTPKRISYQFLSKLLINVFSTHKFACSKSAYDYVFGKNYRNGFIIKNPINTKKFIFDITIRNRLKKEFNLENKIVLGNIGRLVHQKNQLFLLELMKNILVFNVNYVLVLVGDGPDSYFLKQKASELSLTKNIIFLGFKKDPQIYYNLFDYFVFPSLYEGLGIVLIESQINGLKVICNNIESVKDAVIFEDKIDFQPLDINLWTDKIINSNYEYNRKIDLENPKVHQFEMKNIIKVIEKVYKT